MVVIERLEARPEFGGSGLRSRPMAEDGVWTRKRGRESFFSALMDAAKKRLPTPFFSSRILRILRAANVPCS